MKNNSSCLKLIGRTILGLMIVLLVITALLFWPVNPAPLASHAQPVSSYTQAIARLDAIQSAESDLNPLCKAFVLTHGQKVQQAVILVHGYTTCPNQFRSFADILYNAGYNVLALPLPHHGLADRMNTAQGNLTAEELAGYADTVVDIAHGLGDKVTMVGFSAGGATAAWTAQHRPDLNQVVIISPTIGLKPVPTMLRVPFMHVYLLMPNNFVWWNETKKEACEPDYAYPRYATHSVAQSMRLGLMVQADAGKDPMQAASAVVVTNANDQAVDNTAIAQLVDTWQKHNPGKVTTYEFPADLKLGHDLIDPHDPEANTAVVYAKLIDLLKR
jgi:pimeloyl-ACP methyl ester carboxylesterase